MRWPWISRERHEEVVAELKMRIGDLEIERKRLHDRLLESLGASPLFFPDVRKAETAQPGEAEESSMTDQELEEFNEVQGLEYLARFRPASLGAALRQRMQAARRGAVGTPELEPEETPAARGRAKALFDQAEAEVRGKSA